MSVARQSFNFAVAIRFWGGVFLAAILILSARQSLAVDFEQAMRAQYQIDTWRVRENAQGMPQGVFFISGDLSPKKSLWARLVARFISDDSPADASALASRFMGAQRDFLDVQNLADWRLQSREQDAKGRETLSYQRFIQNIRVARCELLVRVLEGRLISVSGYIARIPDAAAQYLAEINPITDTLTGEEIIEIIARDLGAVSPAALEVLNQEREIVSYPPHLVWIASARLPGQSLWSLYTLDARQGSILKKRQMMRY